MAEKKDGVKNKSEPMEPIDYDEDFNRKHLESSDKFFKENNPGFHAVMEKAKAQKRANAERDRGNQEGN